VSHFAEIDPNGGTVLRVLVVPDEQEHRGQDFLANELGLGGVWVQTSYNANIRFKYAGIGDTYDATRDAFISPKCHDEATLDEATCQWNCSNEDHITKEIENV